MDSTPLNPTPQQGPQGPLPVPPKRAEMGAGDSVYQASLAGFAKMLGPTATPEEVKKAMDQVVYSIILQIKKDEEKAKKASRHLRDVIEGKDDDMPD